MSNLSTFAEVGLVDARASAGTLVIPSSRDIPGRVITFKDLYGATGNSTIALLTSTGDVFEDGTNYRTLQNPYDFVTLYAASTSMWSIIGGTQVNAFRANIMSNSSNFTSSLQATTLNSAVTFTSFLYPQTGLTFTVTSNLIPPVNATLTSGASIGQASSNYWQMYSFQNFSQSTFTSNIVGGSVDARSTIFLGNSITPAYSTNRISTISLGTNTNRFFQGFFVSTITSSITTDTVFAVNVSTQSVTGFSLLGTTILSTQQLFCSSLQIGPTDSILDILGSLRTQDLSTLTLQASTITSGTMTLDRLFGGSLLNATTTANIYPFSAGSLVGYGSNIAQGGFYAEGHFRSTFTQVIQPTLDNDGFSNVVFIRGNVSTPSIISSNILSSNITTLNITAVAGQDINVQGSIIPNTQGSRIGNLINGVNAYRFGSIYVFSTFTNVITGMGGVGQIGSTVTITNTLSTQNQVVSSITMNSATGTTLSMSTVTTNALTLGSGGGFVSIPFIQSVLVSTIQINNSILNTSNLTLSTVNRKLYPYTSTLGVPASSFSLSGALANNITSPLVLYSNVAFPHAGFFNFSQSAIFSRTNATANVPQASIFYTPGIYPSTLSNIDAYGSLPYLGNANASSFTTLSEIMYVSTTQLTRNIIYSDPTGNAYTANLFMSPITIQYVPNNSLVPE